FENTSPSVVYVTTLTRYQTIYSHKAMEQIDGTGSGFLWDSDGHVVTNYHVVRNIKERKTGVCRVTLHDRTTWDAKIIGIAPDVDLAVLRIPAPAASLRPIAVGTSGDLKIGQTVFAIGNPFGLDSTLTSGLISAIDRHIAAMTGRTIEHVIQTDAAINPGNSGGPLLDSAGRLIGVNTAIRGDAQNIGFAVPVDTVNAIIPELVLHGRVLQPGLGAKFVPDWKARQVGIDGGLVVFEVARGGAAEKAGLRGMRLLGDNSVEFDLVVKLGDTPVASEDDLQSVLAKHRVGDKTTLSYRRGTESFTETVELQQDAE
ncbi:MAG: S1C family serine protease, partial [Planctomycetia bacterium]